MHGLLVRDVPSVVLFTILNESSHFIKDKSKAWVMDIYIFYVKKLDLSVLLVRRTVTVATP